MKWSLGQKCLFNVWKAVIISDWIKFLLKKMISLDYHLMVKILSRFLVGWDQASWDFRLVDTIITEKMSKQFCGCFFHHCNCQIDYYKIHIFNTWQNTIANSLSFFVFSGEWISAMTRTLIEKAKVFGNLFWRPGACKNYLWIF